MEQARLGAARCAGAASQRGKAPATPPSTGITAPVVRDEASESRNAAVAATSAVVTRRLRRLREA